MTLLRPLTRILFLAAVGLLGATSVAAVEAGVQCVDKVDNDGDGLIDCADPECRTDLADPDGDGIPQSCDNCLLASNPGQEDTDGDDYGDLCDLCPSSPTRSISGPLKGAISCKSIFCPGRTPISAR